MPGHLRYQDKARAYINNLSSPIKMESAPPKSLRPAVAREATCKETRFLLSIIANNVQGLQEGFSWHSVAMQTELKAPSATLALQIFSDLKASLAVPPLKNDLKEATLEELDTMIAYTKKKMADEGKELGEMIKERELKRAMSKEQEKLEIEEMVLRERRETLRERTMESLKRKRDGEVKVEEEVKDVKVKKEKLDENFGVA